MLRSEWRRVRASRTARAAAWVAGVVLVGQAAFLVALRPLVDALVGLNDVVPNATQADRMDPAQLAALGLDNPPMQLATLDVTGSAGGGLAIAGVLAAVAAALVVGNEFRRGSIVASALLEPRRERVLAAKVAAWVLPVATAMVALAVVRAGLLALGVAWQGSTVRFAVPAALGVTARGVLAVVMLAVVGVGVAMAVRSAGVAVAVLAGVAVLESSLRPLLSFLVDGPTLADLLPYGLVGQAVALPAPGGLTVGGADGGLSPVLALGVLGAWTVGALGLGWWRWSRSDVPART
ncbi:hypothetical protein LFM56_02735 [Cellulomonas iranensis]|uniref:hypothetical protein n=1 Tax=Cellulomonas iranensis TaxID=76862 RepID=UPI001CF126C6|nr:hypothetical protein [Cellulomonas iranensis]UCN15262.1 hypothetical protein LFM56_02735 [Cellulomonas iranensis]